MNIVNLSTAAILHIAEAATRADANGQPFRLAFDHDGNARCVKFKVGESVWSAPFYDERESDPYRD